jgi:hypothetical protein
MINQKAEIFIFIFIQLLYRNEYKMNFDGQEIEKINEM